jgi:hypothetical protein
MNHQRLLEESYRQQAGMFKDWKAQVWTRVKPFLVVDVKFDEQELPEPPKVFQWVSLALPARLYKEDLGDALELLARLERQGAPRWQRQLKIACTCFWLLVNTARELTSVLHGAGAKQKGSDR